MSSKKNIKKIVNEINNEKIKEEPVVIQPVLRKATKIEGSIIKIKDSTIPSTANFSIAKVINFSNEKPLIPVSTYCPAMKQIKQLKDYYNVDTLTYKMTENMFAQSPCFANVEGYSFTIKPIEYTNATGSQVKSNNCSVGTFTALNNASLRLKFEGSKSASITLNSNNREDALREVFSKPQYQHAKVFVAEPNIILRKGANERDIVENAVNNTGYFYEGKYDEDQNLSSIEPNKNVEGDLMYKQVLLQNGNTFRIASNNTHYCEVDNLDFSGCSSMDEVLNILNDGRFPFVKFSYVDNKLVITNKAVGIAYSVSVEDALNVGTGVDIKNLIFQDSTAGYAVSNAITPSNFSSVTDGSLKVVVDGSDVDLTALDFTGVINVGDVVAVIRRDAIGFSVEEENGKIKFTSGTTGSSSTIELQSGTSGTDLLGSSYLNGTSETMDGSDGAEVVNGTNGAGDDIIDIYNELSSDPDFNGDVITTTLELSMDEIFNLNTKLIANIPAGNRLILCHTISCPYMTEATSHGELLDWLRTDLIGLYCGNVSGLPNMELRGAVLSMGIGQNVLDSNAASGSKNDLHMKNAIVPSISLSDSLDNDLLDIINSNGCGGYSYFKQGLGWKLTIPSATGCYTWADAVNIQNIIKTFSVALVNQLALRKYTNKTNANIAELHEVLYNLCLILNQNGVLTNDISDATIATMVPVNVEIAKKYIKETDYCCYIYTPDASTIKGKRIPISCYFGFAGSIYGFEIENIFLS